MGVVWEFEQSLSVRRATGSQKVSMNAKIPGKLLPDFRILWKLVGQNVGDRAHRDTDCRGQLLFIQALTELSMDKTFQIHKGPPPLAVCAF